MPWFKVDDQLHDHRKARLAGTHAMGLWVLSGSWCGANPDDGFIPENVVIRWEPRAYRKLAQRLVDAGLWSVDELDGEAGWRFHDWGDFQPTKEEIEAEKAAARLRMKKRRATIKGTSSEDVRPNTERTEDEPTPGVRPRFLDPEPARTDPTRKSGGRALAVTAERPNPWCHRHPGGTEIPCRPCAGARTDSQNWQPPTPTPPPVEELYATGTLTRR